MQAAMASGVVDAVVVPEVPFELGGADGLLAYLGKVLEDRGHAVVCVAEGAYQELAGFLHELNGHAPLYHALLLPRSTDFAQLFTLLKVRYPQPSATVRAT
jgi:6-phosphofructokinase 1